VVLTFDHRDIAETDDIFSTEELRDNPERVSKPEHYFFLKHQTASFRTNLFADKDDGRSEPAFMAYLYNKQQKTALNGNHLLFKEDAREFSTAYDTDNLAPGTNVMFPRRCSNALGSNLLKRRGYIVAIHNEDPDRREPRKTATIVIMDSRNKIRDSVQTVFANFAINRITYPRVREPITAKTNLRSHARKEPKSKPKTHLQICQSSECWRQLVNMIPAAPGTAHGYCSNWCRENKAYTGSNCFNGCQKPPASGQVGDPCEFCIYQKDYEKSSAASLPSKRSPTQKHLEQFNLISFTTKDEVEFDLKGQPTHGIITKVFDDGERAVVFCPEHGTEDSYDVTKLTYNMFPAYAGGPPPKSYASCDWQLPNNVHYKPAGWKALASDVASAVRKLV
jgi:hypothetical protein